MNDRTAELDRLMRERGMTARQVGNMLNRTPKTVRNWRCRAGRTIPEHALAILRAKLGAAQA